MNIYGLTKKNTVDYKSGCILNDKQYFLWQQQMLHGGAQLIGPVNVEGYMNTDTNFIAPYVGRYG